MNFGDDIMLTAFLSVVFNNYAGVYTGCSDVLCTVYLLLIIVILS